MEKDWLLRLHGTYIAGFHWTTHRVDYFGVEHDGAGRQKK